MSRLRVLFSVSCGLAFVFACSPPEKPSQYPPREAGCEVRIFPDKPSYSTDNIGPVSATCNESIADSDCMRTLMDQACKLGADTIWQVNEKPEIKNEKKHFYGRAAHQKEAAPK